MPDAVLILVQQLSDLEALQMQLMDVALAGELGYLISAKQECGYKMVILSQLRVT